MLVMKNPLDYLWYKIYKAFSYIEKSSPFSSCKCMSVLLIINLLTIIWLMLGRIHIFSIIWILTLIGILIIPYLFTKKQAKILWKYKNESEKSRIRGNIIVTMYIILSFVILFLVVKYHITIQNVL
jgi:hypothetical protein